MDSTFDEAVKSTMIQVLDLTVTISDLTNDTPLYSSVIRLDSLGLLHLIVALEQEFSCEIDDEDVMEADLATVGSVIRLVQQKLPSGRGAGSTS